MPAVLELYLGDALVGTRKVVLPLGNGAWTADNLAHRDEYLAGQVAKLRTQHLKQILRSETEPTYQLVVPSKMNEYHFFNEPKI